jgi:hypothetical protein
MSTPLAKTNGVDTKPRFDFIADWPSPSPETREAVRAFWLREGAFNDETQIAARLPQIVMHARTKDGEVAGVCTAVLTTPPHLAQPVYYWRTFIGRTWRSTTLVMKLIKRSSALLEEYARDNGYPAIGILIELENARFKEKGRMAVWPKPPFVYIGKSPRGLDVRVWYFEGARLKEK